MFCGETRFIIGESILYDFFPISNPIIIVILKERDIISSSPI